MTTSITRRDLKRAARASFIGNFIEWFDYATYGFLAVVIGRVFFPDSDPNAQRLSAYAIFAISFILRPIGAVVWGNWGDKYGRRWALSWSILLMSLATFAMGIIPGYATIGLAAPVLLLLFRMIQGFSASGEYAGAATFLAEYAPKGRRGLYTSIVPASTATGLLAGSVLVSVMHSVMTTQQLDSWGWRIPFILAGPMGLIGRYIRVHLEDTPVFREYNEALRFEKVKHKTPLLDVFRKHTRTMIVTFGVACLNAVAFYMLLSYLPVYLSTEVGVGEADAFRANSIMLACYIFLIFGMGHISDRVGRTRMLMTASVLFVLFTVPLFYAMNTEMLAMLILTQIGFAALLTMNDGTLPTFLAESFPTEVRYTGFAVSFNLANAILGGTAPFVSTWLIRITGSIYAPAWYLVAIAAIAFVAMLAAHKAQHLDHVDPKVN